MLLTDLVAAIGSDRLLTDPALLAEYGSDWTGRWTSLPLAVVRPRTTAEVQAVVRLCNAHDVPIFIQGGNTGLVGGSVGDSEPHVLLSTRDLRAHAEVDPADRSLLVSAGYTLAEVHGFAAAAGLSYGVDVVSRDRATIGGNIATNAGGIRVCAFGDTGSNVLAVAAVTADGEERWHPAADLVGSEGTLGVITAARLRLREPRAAAWSVLVPSADINELVQVATSVGGQLLAAELFEARHVPEVATALGLPGLPVRKPWWLLLEGDAACPAYLPADCNLLESPSELAAAWQYREYQAQLINQRPHSLKLDSSVPKHRLAEFVETVQHTAERAGVAPPDCFIFGHLAVGNLHLGFANLADYDAVQAEVLGQVLRLGGSIRAEHGVGRAKAAFYTPSEQESGLRLALDPARRFNRAIAGK